MDQWIIWVILIMAIVVLRTLWMVAKLESRQDKIFNKVCDLIDLQEQSLGEVLEIKKLEEEFKFLRHHVDEAKSNAIYEIDVKFNKLGKQIKKLDGSVASVDFQVSNVLSEVGRLRDGF